MLSFGALWLPTVGVYKLQPIAPPVILAAFVCGILLIVELIFGGKRKLWLLIGILPAMYWPGVLILGFAAYYLVLIPKPPIF